MIRVTRVLQINFVCLCFSISLVLGASCGGEGEHRASPQVDENLSGVWVGIIYDACDLHTPDDVTFTLTLTQVDTTVTGTARIHCGGPTETIESGTWKNGVLDFYFSSPETDWELRAFLKGNRLEGTYSIRSVHYEDWVHSSTWYADRSE